MTTWYVAYLERDEPRWWNKRLKHGYQHVQLWKSVQYGPEIADIFWLRVDPGMELVYTDAVFLPVAPWLAEPMTSVQRVTTVVPQKRIRSMFFFGPITCVELTKAYLGISSAWIRTPWQLHRYIAKRNYILTHR